MTPSLRCVIDTNIVIKPFIDDPLTEKVNRLFEHLGSPSAQFFAPDLLYVECANVFWKYVCAKLYTADQATDGLEGIRELPAGHLSPSCPARSTRKSSDESRARKLSQPQNRFG